MAQYKIEIANRCIKEAHFLLNNNCSIRECGNAFNLSKSSVHLDVSKRLKNIDVKLYKKVKILLKKNFETKHIKGGIITQKKFKKNKENNLK